MKVLTKDYRENAIHCYDWTDLVMQTVNKGGVIYLNENDTCYVFHGETPDPQTGIIYVYKDSGVRDAEFIEKSLQNFGGWVYLRLNSDYVFIQSTDVERFVELLEGIEE